MKTWLKIFAIASSTSALSLAAVSAVGASAELRDIQIVAAGGTGGGQSNGPALDGLKDIQIVAAGGTGGGQSNGPALDGLSR